jgi:formiminotetrahydrofolate cyclodeaminase
VSDLFIAAVCAQVALAVEYAFTSVKVNISPLQSSSYVVMEEDECEKACGSD